MRLVVWFGVTLLCVFSAQRVYSQWMRQFPADSTAVEVTFTVTGDIMGHQSQIDWARTPDGGYDYAECLRLVAPYLRSSDFAIGNLEVTFGGAPYTGYPRFSSPDTLADFLRDAGFSILTTANNHTCDRGDRGVVRTVQTLERKGIRHVGSYRSHEERSQTVPLIVEKGGLRIAILAYTYGTNGIPFHPPVVVDLIDSAQIKQDMAKARLAADAIIVCMHWGIEYQAQPSFEQKRLAALLAREGATVIVGNHPHVIQPLAFSSDSDGVIRQLTIFSMGNFVSSQRPFPRAGAKMVRFTLRRDTAGIAVVQPQYLLTYVEILSKGGRRNYRIVPLESPLVLFAADPYAIRFTDYATGLLHRTNSTVKPLHLQKERFVEPLRVTSEMLEGLRWPYKW